MFLYPIVHCFSDNISRTDSFSGERHRTPKGPRACPVPADPTRAAGGDVGIGAAPGRAAAGVAPPGGNDAPAPPEKAYKYLSDISLGQTGRPSGAKPMKTKGAPQAKRAAGILGGLVRKKGLIIALVLLVFLCVVGSAAGGAAASGANPQPTRPGLGTPPASEGSLTLTATSDQSFDPTGTKAWATVTKDGGPARTLRAHFIDVGQGDSEFIELPDGRSLLIDGGPTDAGEKVLSYIKGLGYSRIDYVVATHPHEDHIGGLTTVISSLDVGELWAPDASANTRAFEGFLDAIESRGIETHGASGGKAIGSGGAYSIQILGPQGGAQFDDLNDASAIVLVTYGQNRFLFTGDAPSDLISRACGSHVDVLKVGHHGSGTSTNSGLVASLNPTYAVISYGTGNPYGHPTQEALDALSGTTVYGTGANGTVTIESDGTNLSASAERDGTVVAGDAESSDSPGTPADAAATATTAARGDQGATGGTDATVYVTNSGKKYHREGCRRLKKSKIPMSLSDARDAGYGPCSKCNPPT